VSGRHVTAAPPDEDRKAILAMAGEYEVDFDFRETVALQPGYQIKEPYHEDALELVVVAEDRPERIVLQHLLVVGKERVIKHWKQIWTWQDTRIVEFQGRDHWKIRSLAPEQAAGTWSQLVTQIDDSPRYESFGKWMHEGGYSRWESAPTARPLPRREHTKRDDYQILLGVNRHALTPEGWVHEQDNLKQVIDENGKVTGYIARETGLNRYHRTESTDFTKAREYWDRTSGLWSLVSSFWENLEQTRDQYSISEKVGEKSLSEEANKIASALIKSERSLPDAKELSEVLSPFVN